MSDLFGNKYSLNFFDYKNKNNKDLAMLIK